MNELFKKDITIKIISILIAIIFWLYVYNNANPFTTKTFSNIPVQVQNESFLDENGFRISNNYRTSIDITVRGRKDAVEKVRATDFNAALDLSQIKSVSDKTLQLDGPFCTQKDISILSYSPQTIDVQLARNKSGSFPVELKSNITMKTGYVLLKTTLTPDSYPIVAEESIINSVGSIKASLEIKNLDRDTTKTVDCKVYNKDGKEISTLNSELKVTVKLEVAKEVPVSLVTSGRLAADYVETSRLIDPSKAYLTGTPSALAGISEIKTEPIDITGITSNYTTTVPLVLPEGVKLANSTPKDANININIDKLETMDIEVVKEDISVLNTNNNGLMTYEVKTEKLMLQVKGRRVDIGRIQLNNIKPAVDVSGLAEGTHKVPLIVTLPAEVTLLQQPLIEVKVAQSQPGQAATSP